MAAMQMNFGGQILRNGIDGRHGVGKLLFDVPLASQALIMDLLTRGQSAIAKVSQRRIINLDDVDARFHERPCLTGQDLGQVVHEVLHRGIGIAAVILVPVADSNQEWAGQCELGATVSLFHEEATIPREHRTGSHHRADHDIGDLRLALVLVLSAPFKSADAAEELTDVVRPSPLAVTKHVQTDLLLKANGKYDEIVERLLKVICRKLPALRQEIAHNLGQGTDHLCKERWQFRRAVGSHYGLVPLDVSVAFPGLC